MYLFTYGTLMQEAKNSQFLSDATYIEDVWLDGYDLFKVHTRYPGMVEGTGSVLGELYEIDETILLSLDQLEEEGRLYRRDTIRLNDKDIYIYLYNLEFEENSKIVDGVWEEKLINYFAYGSCMNKEDFKRSFDEQLLTDVYKDLGKATLSDYKLAFTLYVDSRKGGVLDIIPSTEKVMGVIYRMKFCDLVKTIDKREGHPFLYERFRINVIYKDKVMPAFTYQVKSDLKEGQVTPSYYYANLALIGMIEHDFDQAYIESYKNYCMSTFDLCL